MGIHVVYMMHGITWVSMVIQGKIVIRGDIWQYMGMLGL